MKEIRLRNPNYINIATDTGSSYGGSQSWFSNAHKTGVEARLNRYGCGTIAMADLWLYLAERKGKTDLTAPTFDGNGVIHQDVYMDYVRSVNKYYTFTLPYSGINAIALMAAFNRYAKKFNLGINASYRAFLNNRSLLDLMIELLQKDFPIILAIGPNFPDFWGKFGIPFYTKNSGSSYIVSGYDMVHSHYVTVTGIDLPLSKPPMLQISSWGREYFINYWEFRKYVHLHGNRATSGILELS